MLLDHRKQKDLRAYVGCSWPGQLCTNLQWLTSARSSFVYWDVPVLCILRSLCSVKMIHTCFTTRTWTRLFVVLISVGVY